MPPADGPPRVNACYFREKVCPVGWLVHSRLSPQGIDVLVVDDHTDSREALSALIASFGATVHDAHDGEDALRVIAKTKPDLLFCDLQMPGMDGFELVRRLRADADLCRIRLIAVSDLQSDDDFQQSWEAGFDGHLVKPMTPEIIAAQLERAFAGTLPPPPAHSSRAGEPMPRLAALAVTPSQGDLGNEPHEQDGTDDRATASEATYDHAQSENGEPVAEVREPPSDGAAPRGDQSASLGAADEDPAGGAARGDSRPEET